MSEAPIEELRKQCNSMYKLVILAAKRAKELVDGSAPLVRTNYKKVTLIAIEEIIQGKVQYKAPEEETGTAKKTKRSKPKEKRI